MQIHVKQNRRWPGWLLVMLLVGVGALLALWMQEGAPGWRVLMGVGCGVALVGLLLAAAASKRGPVVQGVGVLGLVLLAIVGAWVMLTTAASWLAGRL